MKYIPKPGDTVMIRTYSKNPSLWDTDGEMMKLMGKAFKVSIVDRTYTSRYYLEGMTWIWSEEDLILLARGKTYTSNDTYHNPNYCFKLMKKEGLR